MTSIGSTGGIGNFEERLTGPGLADQKRSAGGGRSIFSKLTRDVPAGPAWSEVGDSDGCFEFSAGFAGDVVHDPERHGLVWSEVLVDVLKCLLLCCGDVGAGGRDEPELEATGRQLGDLHLP